MACPDDLAEAGGVLKWGNKKRQDSFVLAKWTLVALAATFLVWNLCFAGSGLGWSHNAGIKPTVTEKPWDQAAAPGAAAAAAATAGSTAPRPVADLLCADRPLPTDPCRTWRCGVSAETRWLSCKATCRTCRSLAKAVASDTGLGVRIVRRRMTCEDADTRCPTWRRSGRCSSDTQEMLRACPASCGFCRNSTTPSSTELGSYQQWDRCQDDLSLCPYLELQGYCHSSHWWISSQCRQSCGLCAPNDYDEPQGTLVQGNATKQLQLLRSVVQPQDPLKCRDYSEDCGQWVSKGLCKSNPSYMLVHCKAACNMCDKDVAAIVKPLQLHRNSTGRASKNASATVEHEGWEELLPSDGSRGPSSSVATSESWMPFAVCGETIGRPGSKPVCTETTPLQGGSTCKDSDEKECGVKAEAGECSSNMETLAQCPRACKMCPAYHIADPYPTVVIGPAGNDTFEKSVRERQQQAAGDGAHSGKSSGRGKQAAAGAAVGNKSKSRVEGSAEEEPEDDEEELLVTMPAVGFAAGDLGDDTGDAVAAAVRSSYSLIDTAEASDGMDLVVQGIEDANKRRERLFITSKLHPRDFGPTASRAALDRALNLLKTDYLDLWVMQAPRCTPELQCSDANAEGNWKDTWKAMEEVYEQGKVRSIGVANFNASEMEELLNMASFKPAVLQAPSDPLNPNTHLINICLEAGVVFTTTTLLGTKNQPSPVMEHDVVKVIAEQLDQTHAQVLTRWALQRGMAVLSPFTTPEVLAAFSFELKEAHMLRINALDGTQVVKGAASAKHSNPAQQQQLH